jgi:hypothetical protein
LPAAISEIMSVAEVIDEIRRLPAADLAKVMMAVSDRSAELVGTESEGSDFPAKARDASEEEFALAADLVFIEHRELFRRLAL